MEKRKKKINPKKSIRKIKNIDATILRKKRKNKKI